MASKISLIIALSTIAALVHYAKPYAAGNLENKYFFAPNGPTPRFAVVKAAYACIEDTHLPSFVTKVIDQGDIEYCYKELRDLGAGTDAVIYTLTALTKSGIIRAELRVRLPVCSNYPQEEVRECRRAQEAWRMPTILEQLEKALTEELSTGKEREYTFFADVNCRPAKSLPTPMDTYSCHPTSEEPRRTITYLSTFIADFDADKELEEMSLYAENTGGSGTFYYVIVKEARGSLSEPVFIGDRLQFKSAAIAADKQQLRMEYIGHGPDDPRCCPTVQTAVSITYKNNQLTISK